MEIEEITFEFTVLTPYAGGPSPQLQYSIHTPLLLLGEYGTLSNMNTCNCRVTLPN